MIGFVVALFWGTTKFGLTKLEYITALITLGLIAGFKFFCLIVVLQFHTNTKKENRIGRLEVVTVIPQEATTEFNSAPLLTPPEGEPPHGGCNPYLPTYL